MIEPNNPLRDTKFILTMFVVGCITFLTAIGKVQSKDFQALVTMILAFYAGAKAIFNRKKK